MGISQKEFIRRYVAIRELMEKVGLDCLLIAGLSDNFNRGNIRYVTGSGRGEYCIFPVEGSPIFFVGLNQAVLPKLRRTVGAFDLLEIRETSNPVEQVTQELAHFNRGNKVGVVGMACISISMYLALKERFHDRLVDSSGIFEQLRLIKSPEEIEKMRTAALVTDKVCTLLREIIRPGLSDYEIYGEVKKQIYEMGCEYSFDLIDAEGAKMNMSFYPIGDRLEANGTLFMEITPAYEGYYAQLPVSLPVGNYPNHVRRMVSVWEQAMAAGVKVLRPGRMVSEVYQTLTNTILEQGYISPFRPGHAIGLDVIDFWSITESNSTILKPGMALAIHPSVLLEVGGDGIGMGYTYLITDTGAEKLNTVDLARNE
jgi:Xaa-Pro aminopeptidase